MNARRVMGTYIASPREVAEMLARGGKRVGLVSRSAIEHHARVARVLDASDGVSERAALHR